MGKHTGILNKSEMVKTDDSQWIKLLREICEDYKWSYYETLKNSESTILSANERKLFKIDSYFGFTKEEIITRHQGRSRISRIVKATIEDKQVESVEYEQMVLPFLFSAENKPNKLNGDKGIQTQGYENQQGFIVRKSGNMEEMDSSLSDMNKRALEKYCQALNIKIGPSTNKVSMIKKIIHEFDTNSEYIYIMFNVEELQCLKEIYHLRMNQSIFLDGDGGFLLRGFLEYGFLDCTYDKNRRIPNEKLEEDGSEFIGIITNSKVRSWLKKLNKSVNLSITKRWFPQYYENEYSSIAELYQDMECDLMYFIRSYGLIYINDLYEKFIKTFEYSMTFEEFLLFLNLRCVFKSKVIIGKDNLNNRFICVNYINIDHVLKGQKLLCRNLDYKNFQPDKSINFISDYKGWYTLGSFIMEVFDVPQQEISVLIVNLFRDVFEGCGIEYMMSCLEERLEMTNVMHYLDLWRLCEFVYRNSPMASLKGFTINEYTELFGKEAALAIDEYFSAYQSHEIHEKLHLYQMPPEYRRKAFEAGLYYTSGRPKESVDKCLELLEMAPNHVESEIILMNAYMEKEEYGNAYKIANKIYSQTGDLSIYGILQYLHSSIKDDEMGDFEQTIRNKDKKIYPNDPCPCNSGLKYKKCCFLKR